MKKLIITIVVLFASNPVLFSQESLKDYVLGYCVNYQNDTVFGYLKKSSLAESCLKIEFKKDSLSKAIALSPETIKSYSKDGQFFITKRVNNIDTGSLSFVIPNIQGELSLYTRWINNYRHVGAGKGPLQEEVKHLELAGKSIISIYQKKFNKQVSDYVSDDKPLALKVLTGELTALDSIVNAYNLWHNNGRAQQLTKKEMREIKGQIKYLTDAKFSVNVSVGTSKSYLLLEQGLSESVSVEEAYSPDFGFGIQYSIFDELSLGFGVRYWETQINPSYSILREGLMEDIHSIQVKEKSKLQNTSIYVHVYYERRWLFLGGGFNIALANTYETEIEYYLDPSDVLYSENDTRSLLSSNFYYQSHFDLMFGVKLNTPSNFAFKPFVRLSVPLESLYSTKNTSFSRESMKAYPLTFGVIVDCALVN